MQMTVVVPTHNRCALLRKTLEGLSRQTKPDLLNAVIVVGDGCTDDTADTVAGFSKQLPIRFLQQDRRGVSAARNLGLKWADSPVVLFLDDDVVPDTRLVAEHASFHCTSPQQEAALQGYVTWHPQVNITPFMRWYGEYGGLFGFARLQDGEAADPKFLYTCNISFKSGFLRQHGGFNEALTVLEDHELGYRLAQHGMKMSFRKKALGYHYQTFTFKQACERLRRYSSGLPAFLQTDAGRIMAMRNERLLLRIARRCLAIIGPLLRPLQFLMDTNMQLPGAAYRLFYFYFATYKSFWCARGAIKTNDS